MEFEQSHLAYGMYDRLYLQEKFKDAETIQTPAALLRAEGPHSNTVTNKAARCCALTLKTQPQTSNSSFSREPVKRANDCSPPPASRTRSSVFSGAICGTRPPATVWACSGKKVTLLSLFDQKSKARTNGIPLQGYINHHVRMMPQSATSYRKRPRHGIYIFPRFPEQE